jgi:hypothetical protein
VRESDIGKFVKIKPQCLEMELSDSGCQKSPNLRKGSVECLLNTPEDAQWDILPFQSLPHTKSDPHESLLS